MTRESRKIFRFLSTIQELKRINDKIKDLQWKKDKTPIFLDLISRVGYLIYFSFDNLFVLAALRNLSKIKQSNYIYISHMGWFIANLVSVLKNLYEIFIIFRKENSDNILALNYNENLNFSININNSSDLVGFYNRNIPSSNKNIFDSSKFTLYDQNNNINDEIIKNITEIIARICDMVISSHYIGLPQRFLGFKLNDLVLSICGITSSCIIL